MTQVLESQKSTPPDSNFGLLILLKAMRVHHWIKNLIVFAAPLFALQLDTETLLNTFWMFVSFSLISSSVYLVNDVKDVQSDRLHPVKCKRPIASGAIPVWLALVMALVGAGASFALSFWLSTLAGLSICAYTVIQIGYNLGLKHKTIVDIMCISAGFVLRALAGAAAANVLPSQWFILCVGLLALYLGIEKRKAELKSMGSKGSKRAVLQFYSLPWLTRMESIVTSSVLMTYSLWTIEGARTPWLMVTIPFVVYGIFKYQYLSELGEGEAPEMTLIRSPHLIATLVLWAMTSLFVMLYLSN